LTRIWTDASGAFRVEAQFLELKDNLVHLHKINGVKISVPLQRFAQPDQNHIRHITNTSSVDGSKDTLYMSNGFDWYEFFVKAGISEADAKRYAHDFVKKKMDRTMLADLLDRDVLKNLDITAEGDIIRIRRAVARMTGSSTSTDLSPTPYSFPSMEQLPPLTAAPKSFMKLKEEQDKLKAMELSHAAKTFHEDRHGNSIADSSSTMGRGDVLPSTSPLIAERNYSNYNRSKDELAASNRLGVSSFSANWSDAIKPTTSKGLSRENSTTFNDSHIAYADHRFLESYPPHVSNSIHADTPQNKPSSFVEFQSDVSSDSLFPRASQSGANLSSASSFSSRYPSSFAVDRPHSLATSRAISSPFSSSIVPVPPPPETASFMRTRALSSQPLVPEPSPYLSNRLSANQRSMNPDDSCKLFLDHPVSYFI
jgi:hypothetical protein